MFLFAIIFLIASWLLWTYPFVRQRNAGPKRESVVMAPAARWGIALESVSYGLVWFYASALHPGPVRMIASMITAALSTAFVWWAVRHLGKQWRIQAGLYEDHQLVRSGPYGIVRHPIYASMFGMLIATGLLMTPWWRFLIAIAFFTAGNEIRIRAEEKLLQGRFGTEFEDYRKRVAAYVPFLR
jgi:protein-S-isoprenylcysteine O-methyltransferase Ste14